jgi:hypothetical protein
MTYVPFGKHAAISRLLLCGILAASAMGVMMPRLASPNFGLLDDGVTLMVARDLLQPSPGNDHENLFTLESDRGRLKPVTFLYYALQYAAWGPNPGAFFVIQWLTLTLTAIAISAITLMAAGDILAALVSGLAYVFSGAVIESYYTLSKSEPPMTLWLVLSMLCLVAVLFARDAMRRRGWALFSASAALLLPAYFTKETALAMLPVAGMWACLAIALERKSSSRTTSRMMIGYFLVNLAIALIYLVARTASGTAGVEAGSDSRGYSFAAGEMVGTLMNYAGWYFRDFSYLLPLLTFLGCLSLISTQSTRFRTRRVTLDCILWIAGWTAVMLPWRSALEYYLLPAAVGVAVMTGVVSSEVARTLPKVSARFRLLGYCACLAALCLGVVAVANALTNGRVQIAVDASNSELVDYLASNVPAGGTVLVNLPPFNEYMVELGIHLALLKQRGDIQVRYAQEVDTFSQPGVFIVTPIMRNQPLPVVRISMWDGEARALKEELQRKLGGQARPVWDVVHQVRLATTRIEAPVCAALLALGADVLDGTYCGIERPLVDARLFEYGWEVYKL